MYIVYKKGFIRLLLLPFLNKILFNIALAAFACFLSHDNLFTCIVPTLDVSLD